MAGRQLQWSSEGQSGKSRQREPSLVERFTLTSLASMRHSCPLRQFPPGWRSRVPCQWWKLRSSPNSTWILWSVGLADMVCHSSWYLKQRVQGHGIVCNCMISMQCQQCWPDIKPEEIQIWNFLVDSLQVEGGPTARMDPPRFRVVFHRHLQLTSDIIVDRIYRRAP